MALAAAALPISCGEGAGGSTLKRKCGSRRLSLRAAAVAALAVGWLATVGEAARVGDKVSFPHVRQVEALREELRSDSVPVRRDAVHRLGALGASGGPDAVVALRIALEDSMAEVRRAAASSLAGLASRGLWEAVAAIRCASHYHDLAVRSTVSDFLRPPEKQAVDYLREMQVESSEGLSLLSNAEEIVNLAKNGDADAMELLLDGLADESPDVRSMAAVACGALGKNASDQAVSALLAALRDDFESVRLSVVQALTHIGDASLPGFVGCEAFSELSEVLSDSVPQVRFLAARLLGMFGEGLVMQSEALGSFTGTLLPDIVDALVKVSADSEWIVRFGAIDALFWVGRTAGPAATEVMLEALHDENAYVRERAAAGLSLLGEWEVQTVVRELGSTLFDTDIFVCRSAAAALATLAKAGHPAAVDKLGQAFAVGEPYVLEAVIDGFFSLMHSGNTVAMEAIMIALEAKDDSQSRVATQLLVSLGQNGVPEAVTLLGRALENEQPRVRLASAVALGSLGKGTTPEAVTTLQKAIGGNDPLLEQVASEALESMGKLAGLDEIEAILRTLQDDESLTNRVFAIADLRALGARIGAEGVVGLNAALDDADGLVRMAAADVLGHLCRYDVPDAVASLRRAAEHSDAEVRRVAAESLGSLGAVAREDAVEALKGAFKDDLRPVRLAARDALRFLLAAGVPNTTISAAVVAPVASPPAAASTVGSGVIEGIAGLAGLTGLGGLDCTDASATIVPPAGGSVGVIGDHIGAPPSSVGGDAPTVGSLSPKDLISDKQEKAQEAIKQALKPFMTADGVIHIDAGILLEAVDQALSQAGIFEAF